MASYHLSVKTGGKGSASPHADYISREGKYAREKDSDLEHKESGNMPAWAAHKPTEFWKAADTFERANGCTYREIEIALPRELKPEQRLELVRDFVRQEIGDRHAYQFAIHNPKAAIAGGEQPHAHIIFSERMNDGIDRDPQQYFKRANSKAPERGGAKRHVSGKRRQNAKSTSSPSGNAGLTYRISTLNGISIPTALMHAHSKLRALSVSLSGILARDRFSGSILRSYRPSLSAGTLKGRRSSLVMNVTV